MEITGLPSRGRGTNGMGHSNASIVTYSVVVKKKLHVQAWWPTNKWSREVEVAEGRGGGWGVLFNHAFVERDSGWRLSSFRGEGFGLS